MADIVLVTLNARYTHCAFGLRYLLANLGSLQSQARILEFDIHQPPLEIVEPILNAQPQIVGFGVYIWNITQTLATVALLKRLRPSLPVVLGGPEVSYEAEHQPIVHLADYVMPGEADLEFPRLCRRLLENDRPSQKILPCPLPDLSQVALPYDLYEPTDLAHRTVYVEASRGCPFACEFCLSSLEIPVRRFPLEPLFENWQRLLDRGLQQFKFVDRTFNLHLPTTTAILDFFLDRYRPGLFFHFEVVPDHFPTELRERVARFPPGSLQLEIGIQTFNSEVGDRIRRRQDFARTIENLQFLREQTGAHLHADLILGLPGETLDSFAAGFDQLVRRQPQEIQVGILKRLRGTSIGRHDLEWGMVYRPEAPYDLIENRLLDFPTMQRLRRFARYWDLVANSGNFRETTPLLWNDTPSPFAGFLRWSDWAYQTLGRQHAIPLDRLAEALFQHLTTARNQPPEAVAATLWRDYQRAGRHEQPRFLRPFALPQAPRPAAPSRRSQHRQSRHQPPASPAPRDEP